MSAAMPGAGGSMLQRIFMSALTSSLAFLGEHSTTARFATEWLGVGVAAEQRPDDRAALPACLKGASVETPPRLMISGGVIGGRWRAI